MTEEQKARWLNIAKSASSEATAPPSPSGPPSPVKPSGEALEEMRASRKKAVEDSAEIIAETINITGRRISEMAEELATLRAENDTLKARLHRSAELFGGCDACYGDCESLTNCPLEREPETTP